MRVIPFSSFHPFPSPFFPSPLSDSYTQFFCPFISLFPPTPPPTFSSDSPEGAGSRLTSQPARQQPINYEWQVFGPIKAPPYFMHSKSDCRLLWRVAADMFIVVMAVGAEGGEAEGGGSLPNIRVGFFCCFLRKLPVYMEVKQMGTLGCVRPIPPTQRPAKSPNTHTSMPTHPTSIRKLFFLQL